MNIKTGELSLRRITEKDTDFLYQVFASTRQAELTLTNWSAAELETFLRMQFNLQQNQYLGNNSNPAFDVIMLGQIPVGRLYVDRRTEEFRVIDISLLNEYRGRGIGGHLMKNLLREADDKQVPVTLHVERHNQALRLYHRLGFLMEQVSDVYCFMKRPPRQADSGKMRHLSA